jgi:ribosomal 30S subunit maturation factor RimM
LSLYDDMITIGVVVKPQGRKGEVLVQPLSDRPDRFESLRRVFVPVPGAADARAVSYYHYQLKGLRAEDPAGRTLGTVADVLVTGGEAPVLVVRGGPGGEVLIPMAEAFIRQVDLEQGRIVAVNPEPVDAK